jgi:hypothetical protein
VGIYFAWNSLGIRLEIVAFGAVAGSQVVPILNAGDREIDDMSIFSWPQVDGDANGPHASTRKPWVEWFAWYPVDAVVATGGTARVWGTRVMRRRTLLNDTWEYLTIPRTRYLSGEWQHHIAWLPVRLTGPGRDVAFGWRWLCTVRRRRNWTTAPWIYADTTDRLQGRAAERKASFVRWQAQQLAEHGIAPDTDLSR